jgi:Hint-domain
MGTSSRLRVLLFKVRKISHTFSGMMMMMSVKNSPVAPPVKPPTASPVKVCFAGDSLVSMADGSFRRMADIKEGDIVSTGTAFGDGVVTKKIVNPVQDDAAQQVIVTTTAMGELVGTGHHPVLVDGEWPPLAAVASMETIPGSWSSFVTGVDQAHRVVDAWYNLEIDGDVDYQPGDELISSHSYVVNGVVVSGSGDNFGLKVRLGRGAKYNGLTLAQIRAQSGSALE